MVFHYDEGYIGGDIAHDPVDAWSRLCRTMHGEAEHFGGNADHLAMAIVELQNQALRVVMERRCVPPNG